MEKNKTTIHYIVAHARLPQIVLKQYTEFLKIVNKGPAVLGSYLELIWNETKKDLKEKTKLEVLDNEQKIDLYSFQISLINISENKQILNIIMPTFSQYTEARFITILLVKKTRYFTCELSKSFNPENSDDYYILGEWEYDSKKDAISHKNYGRIEEFTLKKYLDKIDKLC